MTGTWMKKLSVLAGMEDNIRFIIVNDYFGGVVV